MAEIIEAETENYMKMDPDPFDERHPSRADPDCALGHILKVLFRKDSFMNKVCFYQYIKTCFKKFQFKNISKHFYFCVYLRVVPLQFVLVCVTLLSKEHKQYTNSLREYG